MVSPNPRPFFTGYLPEQDGHQIYYEQYGNENGPTIVVFHGGPGDKSKPRHIGGYELDKYRVIIFDQRGCGKSTPSGDIENNTTQDILEDTERLRATLKVNTWFVAGGSWGSTAALAYAEAYPDRVRGLLLSSIFLARKRDEEWSFTKQGEIGRIFPDVWEHRVEFLEKYGAKPTDAAKLLLSKLESSKPEVAAEIAAGVMDWEGNLMDAQSDVKITESGDVTEENIASVKIFLHYESNAFFLNENQLLNNVEKIKNIPTVIVHGRYDLLCPVEQTWELQKHLDKVDVVILPTSNHRLTAEGRIAKNLAYNYFLSKHSHK